MHVLNSVYSPAAAWYFLFYSPAAAWYFLFLFACGSLVFFFLFACGSMVFFFLFACGCMVFFFCAPFLSARMIRHSCSKKTGFQAGYIVASRFKFFFPAFTSQIMVLCFKVWFCLLRPLFFTLIFCLRL